MKILCLCSLLLLTACTRPESPKSRQEGEEKLFVSQQKQISKAVKTPGEVNLHGVVFVLAEADSLYREVLRLALNDKTIEHTVFYKIQRVLGREDGVKIAKHSGFGCEQVEVEYLPQKENWQKISVFEKCFKDPVLSFAVDKNEKSIGVFKLSWQFEAKAFTKVMGLGASLVRSQFRCDMDVQQFKLVTLDCQQMAQQKNNSSHILTAEKFSAKKVGERFEIILRGQLSDNLEPLRKVELKVPLEGKIKILETELFPKEDLEDSALVLAPATSPAKATTTSPAVSSPGNSAPALMPGGANSVIPGSKPSKLVPGGNHQSGSAPGPGEEEGQDIEPSDEEGGGDGEMEEASDDPQNSEEVPGPQVIPPPEAPRSGPNER